MYHERSTYNEKRVRCPVATGVPLTTTRPDWDWVAVAVPGVTRVHDHYHGTDDEV